MRHTKAIFTSFGIAAIALGSFVCAPLNQPQRALPQHSAYTNAVGGEMAWVPPGETMLGSTLQEQAWAKKQGAAEEQFQTQGELRRPAEIHNGFWLGRYEVTAGQWHRFISATKYRTDTIKGLAVVDSYPQVQPDDHPVAWVTWTDAVTFCDWLTQQEKRAGRLPDGYVLRLPTEAEWEYACRGGRKDTMFWWGDSAGDGEGRLNWGGKGQAVPGLRPIGFFGRRGENGFGLSDMLGNIRELCLDAWDTAGAHAELNADYTNNKSRVIKGGSYRYEPFDVRCARRMSCPYSYASSDIGFRVCCGVSIARGTAVWGTPSLAAKREAFPRTVNEAVDRLHRELTTENIDKIRYMKHEELGELQLGLVPWIVENFDLAQGNKELLADCRCADPEKAARKIIEEFWKRLQ